MTTVHFSLTPITTYNRFLAVISSLGTAFS